MSAVFLADLVCHLWGKVGHHVQAAQACPGDTPNYKVFRKHWPNGSAHGVKPVVAYARGDYLQRAVDADEFLR